MEYLEGRKLSQNEAQAPSQLQKSNSMKKKRKFSMEDYTSLVKQTSKGINLTDLEVKNPDENYKKIMEAVKEGFELTSPATSVRKMTIPNFVYEDETSNGNDFFSIGVIGGANSGKTIMSYTLKKVLESEGWTVTVLKERDFLKPIEIENAADRENFLKNFDFDCKEAIDYDNFRLAFQMLLKNKPFDTPVYNYFTRKREKHTKKLEPAQILIIEGRLLLTEPYFKETINLSIYLDTDLDILLSRRVIKQITIGFDVKSITDRFLKFVKPAHERLVEPSKRFADITLHNFEGKVDGVDPSVECKGTSSMIFKLIPGLIMFHRNQNKGDKKEEAGDDQRKVLFDKQ